MSEGPVPPSAALLVSQGGGDPPVCCQQSNNPNLLTLELRSYPDVLPEAQTIWAKHRCLENLIDGVEKKIVKMYQIFLNNK